MERIKNFYLVYDFHIENDFLPNSLNLKKFDKVFDKMGSIDGEVTEYYFRYLKQIPVVNNNLNVNNFLLKRITFSEYESISKKEPESVFIYPIEPYANISHILGGEHSLDKGNPFPEFMSKKSLDKLKIKDNQFYCIISFPTEGDASDYIFKEIYNICERYEIDPSKIILVSASYDIDELHNTFIGNNNINLKSKIKTLYWSWSLREKAQEHYDINKDFGSRFNIDGSQSSVVLKNDLDGSRYRQSKFILFNRRMRAHRIVLLSLLGIDFIKNNKVSYDITKGENDYHLHFFKGSNRITEEYEDVAYNNFIKIQQERQISSIDFRNVHGTVGFGCEMKEPYLDSYIHIVTETNFYEPGLYFSEKTWKPILNLQPFIQLNYPNSLKALREMGFKTFHPFIDESYDGIIDNKERMVAVFKEIERINNLNVKEIHDWYFSIREILIHNQEHALKHREKSEYQLEIEKKYIEGIKNYVIYNKKNKKLL